ncbi:MAG: HPF/RaiA family ribosome-associated protein [Candidatus Woesearchaeota archaeon]
MAEEKNNEVKVVELGGNIKLTGFSELVPGSMTIIKKIVGTYTKRYAELVDDFTALEMVLKPIHKTEKVAKNFQVNAKMIHAGKVVAAEAEDRNVFKAIDDVLKKIEATVSK